MKQEFEITVNRENHKFFILNLTHSPFMILETQDRIVVDTGVSDK